MKTGLESLDTGASKITYSGNEGPKSPMQMAMAVNAIPYCFGFIYDARAVKSILYYYN